MEGRPCGAEGCTEAGTKLCSRCGQVAYCSADCQRKAWKVHKQTCQKVDSPENRIEDLLRKGLVFSAKHGLKELSKPNSRLQTELEERISAGISSEVVDGRLKLNAAGECGRGYIAAKDLQPGEPLLFDTAFCWAPLDGEKAFFYILAERAIRKGHRDRRSSARADAQVDFYHSCIKELPTKDPNLREYLDDSLDEEKREQILLCSIAEASSLFCSEELNHVGLFPAVARFNHSCVPNAVVESSRTEVLISAKVAVKAGEEVTISYLPEQLLELPGPKRQERLEAGRGVKCRCPRCQEEGAAE
eukprot:TRINITY_DN76247_c0_g1_i1.p1 TRINITY_DN76247_c0_g1~~TRINITY_DN76247_c0_g1_i1.p1  ORF type:complete len:303 (+),score=72.70 TRINITY_DN76247_c0_g1_i1:32-940(+)